MKTNYRILKSNDNLFKIEKRLYFWKIPIYYTTLKYWPGYGENFYDELYDSFEKAQNEINRLKKRNKYYDRKWIPLVNSLKPKTKDNKMKKSNVESSLYLKERYEELKKSLEEIKKEMLEIKAKAKKELEWIMTDEAE